jgi:hypothetical protein
LEDIPPLKLRLLAQYRGFSWTKFLDGDQAGFYVAQAELPRLLDALSKPIQPKS